MENKCKHCIFSSDNPEICDFGEGKVKKPESLLKDNDFNISDCPFSVADYYYVKLPDDQKKEVVETRKNRAKKYYI